jgi:putative ABC transport system substrate-binding protein
MNRRDTIFGLLALGIAPFSVHAQQAGKMRRIGVLLQGSEAEEVRQLGEFRRGLRDLGYEEGRNIAIESRFPAQQPELFDLFAAELVRLSVDVLVAVSPPAALAAKRAATRTPVVFGFVPDPVGIKLVDSLSRPGSNVTGLSVQSDETSAKRLQLLKEAMPTLSHVTVLVNPNNRGSYQGMEAMQAAAEQLKVTVRTIEVRSPNEVESAFSAIARERANGVVVGPDGIFFNQRARIAALALERKLPTVFVWDLAVESGALMAYGPNVLAMCYRLAYFVDKILKGAKPGDLPVEQPTKFDLAINLKTAKALALTIPQSILLRADRVIE